MAFVSSVFATSLFHDMERSSAWSCHRVRTPDLTGAAHESGWIGRRYCSKSRKLPVGSGVPSRGRSDKRAPGRPGRPREGRPLSRAPRRTHLSPWCLRRRTPGRRRPGLRGHGSARGPALLALLLSKNSTSARPESQGTRPTSTIRIFDPLATANAARFGQRPWRRVLRTEQPVL